MIRQIEGRNPVHEVLKTKKHITKIFVEENKQDNVKVKKILELARQKKVHVEVKQFISNLAKTPRHQGVIAYVEDQEYKLKDLVDDMMQSDLKLMTKDVYLQDGGYKTMSYFE